MDYLSSPEMGEDRGGGKNNRLPPPILTFPRKEGRNSLGVILQRFSYTVYFTPSFFVESRNALINFWVIFPGFPSPITRPSIFTTGITSAAVPVRKASSALNKS